MEKKTNSVRDYSLIPVHDRHKRIFTASHSKTAHMSKEIITTKNPVTRPKYFPLLKGVPEKVKLNSSNKLTSQHHDD